MTLTAADEHGAREPLQLRCGSVEPGHGAEVHERRIEWRGVTPDVPIRSGASFVGRHASSSRRLLPDRGPDPVTALARINWIAEITVDTSRGWTTGDWNRRVDLASFIEHFEGADVGAHHRADDL